MTGSKAGYCARRDKKFNSNSNGHMGASNVTPF